MSSAAVAAFLNNIPTLWAVPLAIYIARLRFDLLEFCSTDPPPVPNFTALDAIDLINVYNPVVNIPASDKFQQLVGAYLWYTVCQCSGVQTPAAPAPLPAPPGLPAINPPAVGPAYPTSGQQNCGTIQAQLAWTVGDSTHVGASSPVPTGATRFHGVATWSPPDSNSLHSPFVQLDFLDSTGFVVQSWTAATVYSAGPVDQTFSIDSRTVTFRWQWSHGTMSTAGTATPRVDWLCGSGTTGVPVVQPCPPDPFVQGLLEQILGLVTLLQRQVAPFAYVPGPRHNGLTGNGQFAIHGLLGVSAIITTVPPGLGNIAGDPPELFDVGFLTIGSADGWHRSVRLEHNPTLVMPILGSETLVGWTLAPGVVVDLLELIREP